MQRINCRYIIYYRRILPLKSKKTVLKEMYLTFSSDIIHYLSNKKAVCQIKDVHPNSRLLIQQNNLL